MQWNNTVSWEQRKLGDLFNFRYGMFNNNPSNGGQYPVYGAGGIQGGYTDYNAEDSVIIGHMGDAGCVTWGAGKHFVTYNGTITTPKSADFDSKYGYYLLSFMNLRKLRGGSGLPFLTYEMLQEMETKISTSAEERTRISSILTPSLAINAISGYSSLIGACSFRSVSRSETLRCSQEIVLETGEIIDELTLLLFADLYMIASEDRSSTPVSADSIKFRFDSISPLRLII